MSRGRRILLGLLLPVAVFLCAAAHTQDATLWNEGGTAVAIVQRDTALSSGIPSGVNAAVVLQGGVDSEGTARAQRTDTSGRTVVIVHDSNGVGIPSTTVNGAVALNVAVKETPVANPGDSVWQIPATSPFNTTAATKVTVVEYTVPTGKEFYIATWTLAKLTSNSISGVPATLEVRNAADTATTTYDKAILDAPATGGFAIWAPTAITPVRIATAGEKVRLTITPSGASTTEWFGKIVGLTRSI